MLAFPQLRSGAVAQYPLKTSVRYRTVVQTLLSGAEIRHRDPAGPWMVKQLLLQGLDKEERERVDNLFLACEGPLRKFTFLDPGANLLRHSERMSEAVWAKQAGVILTEGRPDPLGTNRGTRVSNATAESRTVEQWIDAPPNYAYVGSVYLRAEAPAALTIRVGSGGAGRIVNVEPSWQRVTAPVTGGPEGEQTVFGIELPGGTEVDVFGAQLEVGRVVTDYRATGQRAGVYASARFLEDQLRWRAWGLNHYSLELALRVE